MSNSGEFWSFYAKVTMTVLAVSLCWCRWSGEKTKCCISWLIVQVLGYFDTDLIWFWYRILHSVTQKLDWGKK